MGEHAIVEIADALDAGLPVDQITYINGTVYRTGSLDEVHDYDLLPSWDDLTADKLNYARSFNVQQQNMDPITGHRPGRALSQQRLCGAEPAVGDVDDR